MATARQFEELEVWQQARQLVGAIYGATRPRAFHQDFGLREQIRRAAVSTMSNIAEGFERGTRKEFIQFLNIAKDSNGKVRSQLYVASDQRYITEKEFSALHDAAALLSRKLSAFVRYLSGYAENSRVKRPARRAPANL
ncbi:MAG: four helix bundle protein [Verrucomicrobiota bacterium]|nr:four helix bundle protein [Verrucomicrobiota bacterium]